MNNKGNISVIVFCFVIVLFIVLIIAVAITNTYKSIEKFCIQNGYSSLGFIDAGYMSERYFCTDGNRTAEVMLGIRRGNYYLMTE
jgi:hypothetical protein